MKVVYTLRHRLHHPQREFEASGVPGAARAPRSGRDHPGRARRRRPVRVHRARRVGHRRRSRRSTTRVWSRFLESAWEEYQRERGHTHDVVPDVFAMAALREGMGPAKEPAAIGMRLGWWCYEITTPLTQGTYEAARSAVDVALTAADHVLDGERVAYGLCRPPGHHAARRDVRRLLLLQQRRDRGRAPRRHHRRQGRRCSTSTTTTATARSRSSTTAATCSSSRSTATRTRLSVPHRASRTRRGAGRGDAARPPTSRCPRAPTTKSTSTCSTAACDEIVDVRPRLPRRLARARHVRRRPDRRPGAHRRRLRGGGAVVARLGLPLSCCKRAATPSTSSARTPGAGCAASPDPAG